MCGGVCVHVCGCGCACVCACVCLCVCTCVCLCVGVCVHVCAKCLLPISRMCVGMCVRACLLHSSCVLGPACPHIHGEGGWSVWKCVCGCTTDPLPVSGPFTKLLGVPPPHPPTHPHTQPPPPAPQISPSMRVGPYCKPSMLVPCCSVAQVINVSTPGSV